MEPERLVLIVFGFAVNLAAWRQIQKFQGKQIEELKAERRAEIQALREENARSLAELRRSVASVSSRLARHRDEWGRKSEDHTREIAAAKTEIQGVLRALGRLDS